MQESINSKFNGRTATALTSLLNANKADKEKPKEPQITVSGFDALTDPNPSKLKCIDAYVYPRSPFPRLVPPYSSLHLVTRCTCGPRSHINRPNDVTASPSIRPPFPPTSWVAFAHPTLPRASRSPRFCVGKGISSYFPPATTSHIAYPTPSNPPPPAGKANRRRYCVQGRRRRASGKCSCQGTCDAQAGKGIGQLRCRHPCREHGESKTRPQVGPALKVLLSPNAEEPRPLNV